MARRAEVRRIGSLLPSSNSVQEADFGSVLPKHLTLHVARMRLTQVEADSTLRIVQEIEAESRKLADVDVDVIVFAATAPSSRNGIGYDRELVKRIETASGKPVLTTNQVSLWHALKIIGAAPLDGLGVLLREHLGAKSKVIAAE